MSKLNRLRQAQVAGERSGAYARKLLRDATKLSAVFAVVAILLIAVSALVLPEQSSWQTLAFAIFGAFLQTAILGLIYEVWLRADVEDATLDKLNMTRDVREHGLIRLHKEAGIDWPELLDGARTLCIVSGDPKKLLGHADDMVFRKAELNKLKRVFIAVPISSWDSEKPWLDRYVARWSDGGLKAEVFCARFEQHLPYDVVGTDRESILLLPRIVDGARVESAKLLRFRKSEPWGIGSWLERQVELMTQMTPVIGHSIAPQKHQTASTQDYLGSTDMPEEIS